MAEQINFVWNDSSYRGSISSPTESSGNDSNCWDCRLPALDCECAFRRYTTLTDPTSELPPSGGNALIDRAIHDGSSTQSHQSTASMQGLQPILQWNLQSKSPSSVQESPRTDAGTVVRSSSAGNDVPGASEQLSFHPGVVSPRIAGISDFSDTVDNFHREAEEIEPDKTSAPGAHRYQAPTSDQGPSRDVPLAGPDSMHRMTANEEQEPGPDRFAGHRPQAVTAAISIPTLPLADDGDSRQLAAQGPLPQCCLERSHDLPALRKHQRCHRKDIYCLIHPDAKFYKRMDYVRHLLGRKHDSEEEICGALLVNGRHCKKPIGRPDNLKRHLQKAKVHKWTESQAEVYIAPFKRRYAARKAEKRKQLILEWDMAPLLYPLEELASTPSSIGTSNF